MPERKDVKAAIEDRLESKAAIKSLGNGQRREATKATAEIGC